MGPFQTHLGKEDSPDFQARSTVHRLFKRKNNAPFSHRKETKIRQEPATGEEGGWGPAKRRILGSDPPGSDLDLLALDLDHDAIVVPAGAEYGGDSAELGMLPSTMEGEEELRVGSGQLRQPNGGRAVVRSSSDMEAEWGGKAGPEGERRQASSDTFHNTRRRPQAGGDDGDVEPEEERRQGSGSTNRNMWRKPQAEGDGEGIEGPSAHRALHGIGDGGRRRGGGGQQQSGGSGSAINLFNTGVYAMRR